jgi:putative ABC transport system substrate-binding protein
MNRRMFLCGFTFGACAAAFVGEAQQTGKVYRIGVLDTLSAALNSANLNAFRQGLRELGYVEGQHFVIEYRSADGRAQHSPAWRPNWFA